MGMLNDWWPSFGIIHYSFLNPEDIINVETYCTQTDVMNWKLVAYNQLWWIEQSVLLLNLSSQVGYINNYRSLDVSLYVTHPTLWTSHPLNTAFLVILTISCKKKKKTSGNCLFRSRLFHGYPFFIQRVWKSSKNVPRSVSTIMRIVLIDIVWKKIVHL